MTTEGLIADIGMSKGNFSLQAALSLPPAGFTVIFGETGSGKTTLLNALAGVERPSSGRISFRGRTFYDSGRGADIPVEARRTGFIFQEGLLFPRMTVRQNLQFAVDHGKPGIGAVDFDEAVSSLAVSPLLDRFPDTLSGGQRQRVAMARTALSDPELLLADEPMQSLDAASRASAMDFLVAWARRRNMKVVMVTHNVAEMFRLADDVVILSGGRVAGFGKPGATLFAKSRFTPQVRESVDCLFEASPPAPDAEAPAPAVTVGPIFGEPGSFLRLRVSACPAFESGIPGAVFTMGFSSSRVRLAPPEYAEPGNLSGKVCESLGFNLLPSRVTLDSSGRMALDPGIGCLVRLVPGAAQTAGLSMEPGAAAALLISSTDIVPIDHVTDATVLAEPDREASDGGR